MNKDTVQNSSKIPSRTAVEEEPVLRRTNNKITPLPPLKGDAGKPANEVNQILDLFFKINPCLNWEDKTQRKAAEFLIKRLGIEKTVYIVRAAISCQGQRFAPMITTPYQLKEKLSQLVFYYQRQKTSKKGITL